MASMDKQSDSRKKLWKTHLQAGNCVGVRKLLIPHGHDLLNEGWSEVTVPSSLKSKPARVWKGRTALHVAVRRGDVKLVEEILNISYPPASASVASKEHGRIGSAYNHLLEVVDNDYGLDALGMAIVNGNNRIVNLLKLASLRCGWNPYDISDDRVEDEEMDRRLSAEDEDIKRLAGTLSQVTEAALIAVTQSETRNTDVTVERMKEGYREDCDFNFIDIDLDMHLFFHATFSMKLHKDLMELNILRTIRKEIVSGARRIDGLLEFLLITLKDGQGRTALHVAVDYDNAGEFCDLWFGEAGIDSKRKIMNAKDSAGRTPLYRAAAKSEYWAMWTLLREVMDTDIHSAIKLDAQVWEDLGIDIDIVSWKNGFRSDCVYVTQKKLERKGFNLENTSKHGTISENGTVSVVLGKTSKHGTVSNHLETISSTALHVAMIHQHENMVMQILDMLKSMDKSAFASNTDCIRRFSWPLAKALQAKANASYRRLQATTTQLAVLVGNVPILQLLLKAQETWANRDYFGYLDVPSFLLAAATGNPALIKVFLDSQGNYTVRDDLGNTALHHAVVGRRVQVLPHLLDFVGCQHVHSSRRNNYSSELPANPQEEIRGDYERNNQEDPRVTSYVQRRGTINLLLEAGMDIWATNYDGKTASPDPDAETTFGEWWYDKVAKVTKGEQTKLSNAANAITVTAALVATASYVGPVTPPLGYSEGDALRLDILAVRIFVVCDSLSFYFALSAIMLALLPALPLQGESMFRELKRTRILVAAAVTILFPSIICVLVAFATGYIAGSPDHGLSHHGLTVATAVVGAFCCFVVIILFFRRLTKVLQTSINNYNNKVTTLPRVPIVIIRGV